MFLACFRWWIVSGSEWFWHFTSFPYVGYNAFHLFPAYTTIVIHCLFLFLRIFSLTRFRISKSNTFFIQTQQLYGRKIKFYYFISAEVIYAFVYRFSCANTLISSFINIINFHYNPQRIRNGVVKFENLFWFCYQTISTQLKILLLQVIYQWFTFIISLYKTRCVLRNKKI